MQTNVAEIRRSLEMASKMAKAMIDFVPMPVFSKAEKEFLIAVSTKALEELQTAKSQQHTKSPEKG